MRQTTLVVMVKEPRPGRVKTRLGRSIGMVAAAWWFRHQVTRLLRRIDDPRWRLVLAVSPDAEGLTSRVWPARLPRVPQGTGNLGDRMGRLLRSLPPGPVCIIGADIPGITRAHIARAFAALGNHDAVIGPAPDGGYWLIGLRRSAAVPARIFDGVRWSSAHARADTIRSLGAARVALIDTLRDVDEARDLNPASARIPIAKSLPALRRPPR
ncbi:MAG: TIGR04282 family arsenosugar biosynthesis glycosyltransferase [Roseovarius sp.]|nr:TIGR04282 family arsenosugar biosynthesis glycosyltransferase [Roseovarius sp.]